MHIDASLPTWTASEHPSKRSKPLPNLPNYWTLPQGRKTAPMYAQRKKLQRKHISPNCFILNYPQGENNIRPHPITLNVCTKSLLRIHSVQHYNRNASRKGQTQRNCWPQSIFLRLLRRNWIPTSVTRPTCHENEFVLYVYCFCVL